MNVTTDNLNKDDLDGVARVCRVENRFTTVVGPCNEYKANGECAHTRWLDRVPGRTD